jgi:hypothetical protein
VLGLQRDQIANAGDRQGEVLAEERFHRLARIDATGNQRLAQGNDCLGI